ncbi:MAG: hypothetical protein ACYS8W_02775 [Planctomycetota bacterium]|jgi:hypothetical protein
MTANRKIPDKRRREKVKMKRAEAEYKSNLITIRVIMVALALIILGVGSYSYMKNRPVPEKETNAEEEIERFGDLEDLAEKKEGEKTDPKMVLIELIIRIAVAAAFIICAVWAGFQPVAACVTALIIYIALECVIFIGNPQAYKQTFLISALIGLGFIATIKSALNYRSLMKRKASKEKYRAERESK